MRPFLRKNLLFFTSSHSSSSQPRALLVRFQLCEFSSSPTPYSHWKRLDEESRNVRVSVWWDFENCNVPAGVNVTKVAPAITDAVRANGIKGPLHITAFGDVLQLSRANQEALAFTGIHLTHIPNGGKNSADRSLLVDLLYWVSQNPPPAHLFLISGDRDFAGILHRLRMNNYNILLAIPGKAPDVLRSAATIMWQWTSLLKGEDLTGKHFNHPPDGPFGSWYGNSKVPLENPFSAADQSTSSPNVEIHEPSPGGIPKSFMRRVRHILSSHPNGISISDFRAELTKSDVSLGKSMFGYKSLSRLLLSIPHVQLKHLGHGKFYVHLFSSESPEASERSTAPSSASAAENDESGSTITPKLHNEGKNIDSDTHRTPSMSSSHEKTIHDDSKSLQSIPSQGKPIEDFVSYKSSVGGEKVVDVATAQLSESQLSPKDNDVSKNEIGSFEVRSKILYNDDIVRSEDVSPKALEKSTHSGNPSAGTDYTILENNDIANCESGKSTAKSKDEIQSRKEVDEVCHSPDSSAADDSLVEKIPDDCAETHSKRSTFFSWIRSWWPFSKSNGKADDLTAHQNKVTSNFEDSKSSELDQTASQLEELKPSEPRLDVSHSGKPELFSSGSFWNDMESFVFTPKGSLLISQSRSREDLAHKLQKHGPMDLKSLTESYMFQLVELLIAEKKWLDESPSQAFPFRLTQSFQRSSLSGKSNGANGLRSLFLSRTSQSNLQKSFEHDANKQCQSIQPTRVSRPATETKYTEMSRDDILVDCQKLVTEILKQHPEGYNIGCFRKQFVDRYGYHLDMKKLGYQKLAYLMQIMPGVKLESTYIYPSVSGVFNSETSILKTQATNASHEDFNSDNELSDTAPKEDNMEYPWEELGPVSFEKPSQNDMESNFTQKAIELDTPKHPDYEPIASDYDSSESEGDSSCVTQPEEQEQGKPKYDEQDSSFWQALDSWHSSKEGETNVKKSENVETNVKKSENVETNVKKSENVDVSCNSLLDILNLSPDSTRSTISKNSSGNFREKQRPQKYSFVADPGLHDKDKLIGGILDGFKKTDESNIQN